MTVSISYGTEMFSLTEKNPTNPLLQIKNEVTVL